MCFSGDKYKAFSAADETGFLKLSVINSSAGKNRQVA